MPSRGSTCPQCFQEAVQKEDRKRLAWFVKNYEKLAAENRKPRKKLTEGVNTKFNPSSAIVYYFFKK